jgi:transposase
MQSTVTLKPRQMATREMVRLMEQGVSVREARMNSAVPMHWTTIYRLLKRVQSEGEEAFTDGRHGHPVKLRGEVLAFVVERCQIDPCISSPTMQRALQERFALAVSVSQLNRVRVSLGLTRKLVPREKKAQNWPVDWDLRGYTADGLALLTGRKRAYGYRYTEAFLS